MYNIILLGQMYNSAVYLYNIVGIFKKQQAL